jgi:hypothetical protein
MALNGVVPKDSFVRGSVPKAALKSTIGWDNQCELNEFKYKKALTFEQGPRCGCNYDLLHPALNGCIHDMEGAVVCTLHHISTCIPNEHENKRARTSAITCPVSPATHPGEAQ